MQLNEDKALVAGKNEGQSFLGRLQGGVLNFVRCQPKVDIVGFTCSILLTYRRQQLEQRRLSILIRFLDYSSYVQNIHRCISSLDYDSCC